MTHLLLPLLKLSLTVAICLISVVGFSHAEEPDSDPPKKLLRHVVVFKFKEDASEEDIKKVEEAFRALPKQIKEIHDFEWGVNNSPEMLNKGFTHCFLVTFASEKDRDAYLPHPEHEKFVALLRPHLEDAFVVDYWSSK
ncbi:MAG: Dabb family protein [Pirellulaceae bacterium]